MATILGLSIGVLIFFIIWWLISIKEIKKLNTTISSLEKAKEVLREQYNELKRKLNS